MRPIIRRQTVAVKKGLCSYENFAPKQPRKDSGPGAAPMNQALPIVLLAKQRDEVRASRFQFMQQDIHAAGELVRYFDMVEHRPARTFEQHPIVGVGIRMRWATLLHNLALFIARWFASQ